MRWGRRRRNSLAKPAKQFFNANIFKEIKAENVPLPQCKQVFKKKMTVVTIESTAINTKGH